MSIRTISSYVVEDDETAQRTTKDATHRTNRWLDETNEYSSTTRHYAYKGGTSTIDIDEIEISLVEESASRSQVDKSTEPPHIKQHITAESDSLEPSRDKINHTFHMGRKVWHSYVYHAALLPPDAMSTKSLDPSALLQHMPSLPKDLPRIETLKGQAIWELPNPQALRVHEDVSPESGIEDYNQDLVYGRQKEFALQISQPTECRISSQIHHLSAGKRPNGIAILTLLWAYIFSVRFLEMQKRRIYYSTTRLSPMLKQDLDPRAGDIVIDVSHASQSLIRWLCAVLAPGMGWKVGDRIVNGTRTSGFLPPWAAHYSQDTRFIVVSDTIHNPSSIEEKPPSSCVATDLLIELCVLWGLGDLGHSQTSQQPTISFLAALVLPFNNFQGLQPQLPMPSISMDYLAGTTQPEYIRDYVKNLRYYMTLSLSPASIGSIIWSIFWEPGLDSNVVGAWFGAIRETLKPTIEAKDLDQLAKIFLARRLQPALLWLGVLVLNETVILDMLSSYLESSEERMGFASLGRPDVDVAAWTGSGQSFLDETTSLTYTEQHAKVPRSHILRCRFNLRLSDANVLRYGWQLSGNVLKEQIEPDLWPWLESNCSREYKRWVWWLPDTEGSRKLSTKDSENTMPRIQIISEEQNGFRRDNNMHKPILKPILLIDSYVEMESESVVEPEEAGLNVWEDLSRRATYYGVLAGARDVAGDRFLQAICKEEVRSHPWMSGAPDI